MSKVYQQTTIVYNETDDVFIVVYGNNENTIRKYGSLKTLLGALEDFYTANLPKPRNKK